MRKEIGTLYELSLRLPDTEGKRSVVYISQQFAERKTRCSEEELVGMYMAMWDLLMLLPNSEEKLQMAQTIGSVLYYKSA